MSAKPAARLHAPRLGLLALVAAAGVLASIALAGAAPRADVKVASNTQLHARILVTPAGRTLYHLTAEKGGRFICTNAACRALWTPLVAVKGHKPAGANGLGTVKRPDGHTQVTYRGAPLYTFVDDHRAGSIKGNGFKDVGTWLVATVGHSASAPASATTTTMTTTSGGYTYP